MLSQKGAASAIPCDVIQSRKQMRPCAASVQGEEEHDSHIRNVKNVNNVIGCELKRQLSEPGGGCTDSIVEEEGKRKKEEEVWFSTARKDKRAAHVVSRLVSYVKFHELRNKMGPIALELRYTSFGDGAWDDPVCGSLRDGGPRQFLGIIVEHDLTAATAFSRGSNAM